MGFDFEHEKGRDQMRARNSPRESFGFAPDIARKSAVGCRLGRLLGDPTDEQKRKFVWPYRFLYQL